MGRRPRGPRPARRPAARLAADASPTVAQPLLRWVGGKGWAADEILDHAVALLGGLPTALVDPCCGGGLAVPLRARARWPGIPLLLGDLSAPTVQFARALTERPRCVEGFLAEHAAAWRALAGPDHVALRGAWHRALRERLNAGDLRSTRGPLEDDPSPRLAAAFAALCRGAYNGLARFNASGGFNATCGAHADDRPDRELAPEGAALAAGLALAGARVRRADLAWAGSEAPAGSLVLLDPIYEGTFAGYLPGGVAAPVDDLAAAMRRASARGAAAVCTQPSSSEDLWRERAPDVMIFARRSRRGAMNPDAAARGRPAAGEIFLALGPFFGLEK